MTGAPATASQKRIIITGSGRVRKVCLEAAQEEMPAQQMVPVQSELLQHQEQEGRNSLSGLDISIKGYSIHVTESTSMPLLEEVLKVVRYAQ